MARFLQYGGLLYGEVGTDRLPLQFPLSLSLFFLFFSETFETLLNGQDEPTTISKHDFNATKLKIILFL